ncbi:MAG: TolC family protein, partial [Gemmatales bacterium]|nr:TolC family protein [Gemmatales bacterium]
MRPSQLVLGLSWLVTVCVLGCQQHNLLNGPALRYAEQLTHRNDLLPERTLEEPTLSLETAEVRTVLNPDAPKRYITLAECIALALEHGRDLSGRGTIAPVPVRGQPGGFGDPSLLTDQIRVLAYDPAELAQEIESSLAKFDTQWQTALVWQKQDRPVGTALEQFQAGFLQVIERDIAQFQTRLVKPLPTGGVAGITFRTDYEFSNLPARVNPAYRPVLEFAFEQPLLQGAGVGINQLRTTHPGSVLFNIPTGGRAQGILLARLTYNASQFEFLRRVQELLLGVERAYWELYSAYWQLFSAEVGMRQALRSWQRAKANLEAGREAIYNVAQIEEQYQFFRAQRLQALGRGTGAQPGVLEAERRLRYLIGLPPEDGTRLVPADVPTTAPYRPNWEVALAEALVHRPELSATRLAMQHAQLQLLAVRDRLLPDFRLFGSYNVNSLGRKLDGDDASSAIHNLFEGRFNDWQFGFIFQMPLGFRDAYSEYRQAQIQVAKWTVFLRNQEQATAYQLQDSYRRLYQLVEEIAIQRARRRAAQQQLEAFQSLWEAGRAQTPEGRDVLTALLNAQRSFAEALRDEYIATSEYNIALAEFERDKGTLLRHNNVSVVEGPIPDCAKARASEHIRERARGWILQHAPATDRGRPTAPASDAPTQTSLPDTQEDQLLPLPRLLEKQRELPPLPDKLPEL